MRPLSTGLLFLLLSVTFIHPVQGQGDGAKSSATYPVDKIDSKYRGLVQRGRMLEAKGRLSEAQAAYEQALVVKRYEAESYYVLLDIGRVQYKRGAYAAAVKTLTDYVGKMEIELKVQRGEMVPPGALFIPGYTEEGLRKLMADKKEAEALITASQARLTQ